ncbi:hypothetical protein [Caulobacter sp.]|uniref:hypothetical protein n=1 Tax=Caulobacter sp. TaxID=78 RepID=UPI003BA925E5
MFLRGRVGVVSLTSPCPDAQGGVLFVEAASGLPDWVVEPMMCIGCRVSAVLSCLVVATACQSLLEPFPAVLSLVIYIVIFTLMVEAIKPWTVR